MCSENIIFNPHLEIIGHRGHVSKFPENTVQGFLSAVALGIHAVEMDLVISADKKVVVSHEAFMAAEKVLTPGGNRISSSNEKDYNLYQMDYDRIKQFPTGHIRDRKFPNQKSIFTYKPLLSEIFEKVEEFRRNSDLEPVTYYLEIKSKPEDYEIYQPSPKELAQLVMGIVIENQMENSVVLKSFDARFLNTLKKAYPEIKISFLTYKPSFREIMKHLDFRPEIISPYFKRIRNKAEIEEMQNLGYRVIPWTVNGEKDIKRMINLGVDGIISDYPERVMSLKR